MAGKVMMQKDLHPSQNLESFSGMVARQAGEGGSVFSSGSSVLDNLSMPFPKHRLRVREMAPHTALIGSSGSGKTIVQKLWLEAALKSPDNASSLLYRALVYDPKRELYPFLIGLGVSSEQIIITNPFDPRSPAWDLATDFQEPAQIEELTEMLIPDSTGGSDSEFFKTTGRIILQDLIYGFREEAGTNWELRDLIEACLDIENLKQVLIKTTQGGRTWQTFFGSREKDSKLSDNILASLMAAVRPFQTLANLWYESPKKFSLEKWHRGSGILLMGADLRRETSLQRMNQLMFHRISQLIISREQENPIDLTWFFLDEVREAGELVGLRKLLTEGRSKGARIVLGFQDVDGMVDLYGEEGAEELIGLCAHKLIFHLDNPKTREWASSLMGEEELMLKTKSEGESHSITGSTDSSNVSQQVGLRRIVLPFELHDLPLASREYGVWFFYQTPWRGEHYGGRKKRPAAERGGPIPLSPDHYSYLFEIAKKLPRIDGFGVPTAATLERGVISRNTIWTQGDRARLGLESDGDVLK